MRGSGVLKKSQLSQLPKDTGITVGHPEFGTRATLGASFVSSLFDNEDESELLSDGSKF